MGNFDDSEDPSAELWQAVCEVDDTLLSHNGTIWQYADNQLQYHYKEMPCWILLYDKAGLQGAYEAYRDTLLAHPIVFEELAMNVAFYAPYNNTHYIVFRLYGNDQVKSGYDHFGPLGQEYEIELREESAFSQEEIIGLEKYLAAKKAGKAKH